jgi:hypothetical protein
MEFQDCFFLFGRAVNRMRWVLGTGWKERLLEVVGRAEGGVWSLVERIELFYGYFSAFPSS